MSMPLRVSLMLMTLFILSLIIFQLVSTSAPQHLAASAQKIAETDLCGNRRCQPGEAPTCWEDRTSECHHQISGDCKDRTSCDVDLSIKGVIELTIKMAIPAAISVAISAVVALTVISQFVQNIHIDPIKIEIPPIEIKCSDKLRERDREERIPAPPSPSPPPSASLPTWILLLPIMIFLIFLSSFILGT